MEIVADVQEFRPSLPIITEAKTMPAVVPCDLTGANETRWNWTTWTTWTSIFDSLRSRDPSNFHWPSGGKLLLLSGLLYLAPNAIQVRVTGTVKNEQNVWKYWGSFPFNWNRGENRWSILHPTSTFSWWSMAAADLRPKRPWARFEDTIDLPKPSSQIWLHTS